jgi:hypothetical protein
MTLPTYQPEVRQITQFGVEATPGTLVAAAKQFHSAKFDLDPKKPTSKVMQAGNLFPVDSSPGKGHTEIGVKGDLSVVDAIYLLATQLKAPVFSTPVGGTLSRLATFTLDSFNANAKKTLSIQKGGPGSGNAKKVAYCQMVDFACDFTPDKPVSFTAKMFGRNRSSGQTLTTVNEVQTLTIGGTGLGGTFTLTILGVETADITWSGTNATLLANINAQLDLNPYLGAGGAVATAGTLASGIGTVLITFSGTTVANKSIGTITADGTNLTGSTPTVAMTRTTPGGIATLTPSILFGTSIDVYIAATEAGLAAGQVYPLTCKFNLSKFLGDVYSLNSATSSFDAMVEVAPGAEFDLTLPDDSTGEAFVDSIDTSTRYFIEIIAKGALIEGSLYNQMRVRAPIRFSDPSEGTAQDVHTIGLKAAINHDDAFNEIGGALLVECQSTLTAL